MNTEENCPILFFDGECGLCHGLVRWLLKRDTEGKLAFAPLQGETARSMLPIQRLRNPQSVVYLENGQVYAESDAALRAISSIGGAYGGAGQLLYLPRSLRNFFYRLVARNRYRLFGRHPSCDLLKALDPLRFLP